MCTFIQLGYLSTLTIINCTHTVYRDWKVGLWKLVFNDQPVYVCDSTIAILQICFPAKMDAENRISINTKLSITLDLTVRVKLTQWKFRVWPERLVRMWTRMCWDRSVGGGGTNPHTTDDSVVWSFESVLDKWLINI